MIPRPLLIVGPGSAEILDIVRRIEGDRGIHANICVIDNALVITAHNYTFSSTELIDSFRYEQLATNYYYVERDPAKLRKLRKQWWRAYLEIFLLALIRAMEVQPMTSRIIGRVNKQPPRQRGPPGGPLSVRGIYRNGVEETRRRFTIEGPAHRD